MKFSRTLFLQTTSVAAASKNLRDVFVQQIFSLQLKLCFRLICFHFYSLASSMAKMLEAVPETLFNKVASKRNAL